MLPSPTLERHYRKLNFSPIAVGHNVKRGGPFRAIVRNNVRSYHVAIPQRADYNDASLPDRVDHD